MSKLGRYTILLILLISFSTIASDTETRHLPVVFSEYPKFYEQAISVAPGSVTDHQGPLQPLIHIQKLYRAFLWLSDFI